MFSEALNILDRNTANYMINKLAQIESFNTNI